jgi:hypothetical protein
LWCNFALSSTKNSSFISSIPATHKISLTRRRYFFHIHTTPAHTDHTYSPHPALFYKNPSQTANKLLLQQDNLAAAANFSNMN